MQLALFNILLPFVIVCIIGGGLKAIRGVFLITLICGISTLVPQYFVAIHLGAELPAFAGSLVSLFAVAMVSRLRKGKTDPEWRIEVSHTRETTPRSAKVLFRVGSIYLFIFVFILLCSPLFPTIKGAASQLASVLHFTLADGKTMALKVEWATTPGMLIIFATIIGGFIQGASARGMLEVFIKTIFQLKNSIVAIMAIVALATVMDLSGIISTLAQSIVDLTGSSYVFLAPVIGALGTFVTGSDTNSNILFGKLQTIAASKLHIDPNWRAAANTSGATGGKMISPQSIAIAVSATKMDGQANQIMSGTMKYCCAYIVILGLKVGLFYYWFMA
ncbi:L-lactate permease family protein [Escherichia coli 6-537-08_S1_C2]|nr:L-lactate permease family protein [Escherichia coli 6-537-08_S1_C2]